MRVCGSVKQKLKQPYRYDEFEGASPRAARPQTIMSASMSSLPKLLRKLGEAVHMTIRSRRQIILDEK
jgi:hypothetical protein